MKIKLFAVTSTLIMLLSIFTLPTHAAMGGKKVKISPCLTQGNAKAQSAILKSKMKQALCVTSPEVDPKFAVLVAWDLLTDQPTSPFTWSQAQEAALSISNPTLGYISGAKLTGLRNSAETDLVTYVASLYAAKGYNFGYWTGGTEQDHLGIWTWQDTGQTFSTGYSSTLNLTIPSGVYTKWAGGEPNGEGSEPCVEGYSNGYWNDVSCNKAQYMFIFRFN